MTTKANLFQVEGQHTGLLVAVWLDPALAGALAIDGGEPADQLHLTLCYCGDANELSDVQIGRAINAANETAMMFAPLQGQIAGLGRFNGDGRSDDTRDVIYANVDVPGLAEMRQYLASMLEYADCPPKRDHGYTPHVTLAYVDPGSDLPMQRIATQPFAIRSLWIGVGDRRTEIPLTGSDTKAAPRGYGGATYKAANIEGNALKAVSQTDDELRVANYMVLFGGRDLEGRMTDYINPDGSRGEFFTKSTRFESPYTDLGFLYVDWEHGMAPAGEPGRDEPLGYVDWKSARIDEKGLFVERVLNRRNKYVKYVEHLFDQGVFGASSEAISERVQRKANGEIVVWPLRRDTITVSPMDPRQLSQNTLTAIKALSQRVPALKTIVDGAERLGLEASPEAARKTAADAERKALLLELELELLSI
jgi:2'-5' RNA ligase